MSESFLLPYRWKIAGIMVALTGMVLAIFYLFFDFRFTMPVFALYSSFLETKVCATFTTNFADELVLLLLIGGVGMIVFSKEKTEVAEYLHVRNKSLAKALIANNLLLLFALLFIFGNGFMMVLIFNTISVMLFYLLFFYLGIYRKKKN